MKDKTKKILIIIGIIAVIACYVVMIPVYAGMCFVAEVACSIYECANMPDPPAPEITSAEFDFTVTYSINGEAKTCSGVIECRYAGAHYYGTSCDKYRAWEYTVSLDRRIITQVSDNLFVALDVECNPAQLMGDDSKEYNSYRTRAYPYLYCPDGAIPNANLTEICNSYGISILRFTIDPPIENSFG